ncbi:sensor histidine kinase [Paenibacillus sp. BK720]|uniref:sensor histidine kinase n=1 Tax=Paenibacillus sp. BK720 TaxID=2587092 RepID=UPI00142400F8|nr:sensor histidine kinase [Paenibacillus sp. BK720]NIK70019.1 two-component system sensor histidine kinase YesM [Paenibacillus sp. BK720]
MIPGVLFFVGNNLYAKNVVRDKVTETYRNTLDIFADHTDRTLNDITNYLNKLGVYDTDVGVLNSFPPGSDNYVLTKVRIQLKINRDIGLYNVIDTIFLFNSNELILSTSSQNQYGILQNVLNDNVRRIVDESTPGRWLLWYDPRIEGGNFLVQVSEVPDTGLYVGAIIRMSEIANQLSIQWSHGDIGEAAIYRSDGTRLGGQGADSHVQLNRTDLIRENAPYRFVKDQETGKRYLMMNRPSEVADMTTSILIPESYILQGLPYFQLLTYAMAVGVIFIFSLYLFFIRRTLFKPLQQLIGGMKKISLGMLDVRLRTNNTLEFVFLANTFNNMAEQIKSLRIGMYEEQLRAQKIELKQLQAQINPHFYMNSLNIIYNFAALKDTDSVKKMALHLGDYFRFIMRTNRELITLEEELKHIANYLEIQKFRFPHKLGCVYEIPDNMKGSPMPALSIQPFVENAIIHGFANHRKPFEIRVRGELLEKEDGPFMQITVEDNGGGFPEEVLQRLNEGQGLPSADSSRLGIANVIQRLKLRYDGAARIDFRNTDEGGAAVTIRLPVSTEPPELPEPKGE